MEYEQKVGEVNGVDQQFMNGVFGFCCCCCISCFIVLPMSLLAMPAPDDGVFGKREGGGGGNPTDACPDLFFDHKVYHFFYDEQCARGITPLPGDHETCGVSLVNNVLRFFVGELRIEAQCFGFLSIIFLVMVLQLGGIPIPTPGEKLAIGLWAVWMVIIFMQAMSLPLAIGST